MLEEPDEANVARSIGPTFRAVLGLVHGLGLPPASPALLQFTMSPWARCLSRCQLYEAPCEPLTPTTSGVEAKLVTIRCRRAEGTKIRRV
jgi:hypothetical protein